MYSVSEGDRWMEKRGAIYNDTHCHRLMMKNWLYVYRIRIRYKNVSGWGRKKSKKKIEDINKMRFRIAKVGSTLDGRGS